VGFKPAETGIGPSEVPDSDVLRRASGIDEPLAVPLLRLTEPLAPAVAGDRAGTRLDPDHVDARIGSLRAAGYAVVVEGAGGLLVPLARDYTAADLASRNGLPAVIVARAGLGTLNHILLTAEALRSRGIAIRAVVLNGRDEPPDLAEQTNPEVLARLVAPIPVIVLPRRQGLDPLALASAFAVEMAPFLDPGRS
jgi:dethiobiotin synthetase